MSLKLHSLTPDSKAAIRSALADYDSKIGNQKKLVDAHAALVRTRDAERDELSRLNETATPDDHVAIARIQKLQATAALRERQIVDAQRMISGGDEVLQSCRWPLASAASEALQFEKDAQVKSNTEILSRLFLHDFFVQRSANSTDSVVFLSNLIGSLSSSDLDQTVQICREIVVGSLSGFNATRIAVPKNPILNMTQWDADLTTHPAI